MAKGGENAIYQIEPFVPIEAVAKVSIEEGTLDILNENQLLRLAANPEYICKVLEEIVIFDTKSYKPKATVALIEQAQMDL